MISANVLLAESSAEVRETIERALRCAGFAVMAVRRADLCRELLEGNADLGIIGPSYADIDTVEEVGSQLQKSVVCAPVLLLAANSSEDLAISALRSGVSEYLRYPCGAFELAGAARKCVERFRRSRAHRPAVRPYSEAAPMIGESQCMQEVKAYLFKAASTPSNVLITGETGTGKELAAEFIHRHSPRRDKPFVTVNCAAIPESLLESELFGYERGAFTGAHSSCDGKLKAADGGTVFLDEIGDMSGHAQAKILRAIESKQIQRLGGAGVSVDMRIVAATNQELDALIRADRFRKDLFYRLNVVHVHLPALRERKDDIPAIVSYYLREFNRRLGQRTARMADSAWECLLAYDWPGNVRELKNLLEGALVHSAAEEITASELPRYLWDHSESAGDVAHSERKRMLAALVATNWNKSKAAEKLQWSRMTLYRKMAKYQMPEHPTTTLSAPSGA